MWCLFQSIWPWCSWGKFHGNNTALTQVVECSGFQGDFTLSKMECFFFWYCDERFVIVSATVVTPPPSTTVCTLNNFVLTLVEAKYTINHIRRTLFTDDILRFIYWQIEERLQHTLKGKKWQQSRFGTENKFMLKYVKVSLLQFSIDISCRRWIYGLPLLVLVRSDVWYWAISG